MPADPPLRAVVFDLDGLMFNTEELYRFVGSELIRRRGHQVDLAMFDEMMGLPAPAAFNVMIRWHKLDDTWQELSAESSQIFEGILEDRLAPMPGLLDLLDTLERLRLPKAVATSSGRAFLTRVLAAYELGPRFAFTLCREDVTNGKPDPEVYLSACRRLQVSPGETLVLEDSHNGCRAAIAAGTYAVAVPGDHSRRHDFTGARLVIDSLRDPRLFDLLETES